jgi:hypothetical protein
VILPRKPRFWVPKIRILLRIHETLRLIHFLAFADQQLLSINKKNFNWRSLRRGVSESELERDRLFVFKIGALSDMDQRKLDEIAPLPKCPPIFY